MDAPFWPTHVVPAPGLRAWDRPDGRGPEAARLDGGLEVEVVERRAGWARIVCSNGWGAWVDGRRLLEMGGAPAPASSGIAIRGVGILSLIGVAAVVIGSFLDWWSAGGASLTAWDIPVEFLVTGSGGDGVKTGPLLIVVLVLLFPILLDRPFPSIVPAVISVVPIAAGLAALVRGVRESPSLDPQLGLIVTVVGGALLAVDAVLSWDLDDA